MARGRTRERAGANPGLSRRTEDEKAALVALLKRTIDDDRCPLSPCIQVLRRILAKFGSIGPTPPPPARPPTLEEQDLQRRPRATRRRSA